MTSYTGTINFYNSWKNDIVEVANCGSDTFKMLLTTSSYTPSASHATISDITNEVSGSGYARATLTTTTAGQTGGTYTLDFDNPVFTASGGSIVARYWVIYDDTPTSPADPLVAYGLIDDSVADVTTSDTNTLTITINGSGLLTLA